MTRIPVTFGIASALAAAVLATAMPARAQVLFGLEPGQPLYDCMARTHRVEACGVAVPHRAVLAVPRARHLRSRYVRPR